MEIYTPGKCNYLHQKPEINFFTIMIVSLIFCGNKVCGIVLSPHLSLCLCFLTQWLISSKRDGMVQRQIPTNFDGQRETCLWDSNTDWKNAAGSWIYLTSERNIANPILGKLQLDLTLSLCVNTFMPPLSFVFDIDSLLYNMFMPQILCTSTEQPVDYETELIVDQGLGGLVPAGSVFLSCNAMV